MGSWAQMILDGRAQCTQVFYWSNLIGCSNNVGNQMHLLMNDSVIYAFYHVVFVSTSLCNKGVVVLNVITLIGCMSF